MQPESSDGFASVGTILPEEGTALLPGGSFRFLACSRRKASLQAVIPAGSRSKAAVALAEGTPAEVQEHGPDDHLGRNRKGCQQTRPEADAAERNKEGGLPAGDGKLRLLRQERSDCHRQKEPPGPNDRNSEGKLKRQFHDGFPLGE